MALAHNTTNLLAIAWYLIEGPDSAADALVACSNLFVGLAGILGLVGVLLGGPFAAVAVGLVVACGLVSKLLGDVAKDVRNGPGNGQGEGDAEGGEAEGGHGESIHVESAELPRSSSPAPIRCCRPSRFSRDGPARRPGRHVSARSASRRSSSVR